MKKLVCPKCKRKIETYVVDTDYLDNKIIDFCYGECSNCNTSYKYKAIYKFVKYKDFEEYED